MMTRRYFDPSPTATAARSARSTAGHYARRLTRNSRRPILATAVLSAGLLSGSLTESNAHAALGGCRTDPIVFLSGGLQVELSVAMEGADTSDIQQITYVLRAPAGTRVLGITYTPGPLRTVERVQFVPNDAPGTYDAAVAIAISSSAIHVTTTMAVSNPASGVIRHASAHGIVNRGQAQQGLAMRVSLLPVNVV